MEKMRRRRTDDELVLASEQVLEELQGLWNAELMLMAIDSAKEDEPDLRDLEEMASIVRDTMVQGAALHAELLLGFLYATDPEPDDVVAEDFFDEPATWQTQRPAMDETMASTRRAGAAQRRIKYFGWVSENDWAAAESKQLTSKIGEALMEFVRLAPDGRTSEELRDYLAGHEEVLKEIATLARDGSMTDELRDYLAGKEERLGDEDAQGEDAA